MLPTCVKVCMAHAPKTGGMMELGELRQKLVKSRGKSAVNQVCVSPPTGVINLACFFMNTRL